MSKQSGMEPDLEVLRAKSVMHHSEVYRRGDVVIRETGPWAPTVHSLLRHLEDVGFPAPRLVGSGFDDQGRETLRYIEGEFTMSGPWTLEGVHAVGNMLRDLHVATASYRPPPDAQWGPWYGRDIGGTDRIIGHCDFTPWNIVARDGLPVALIDWDFSGPVDRLVELAQAAWLNAKLHGDDIAEIEGLPPLKERARQLRTIVDAYGLPAKQRRGFVDRIVEFVMFSIAEEADFANVIRETTEEVTHETTDGVIRETTDGVTAWALAWRARAGAWILRNRSTLENALS